MFWLGFGGGFDFDEVEQIVADLLKDIENAGQAASLKSALKNDRGVALDSLVRFGG